MNKPERPSRSAGFSQRSPAARSLLLLAPVILLWATTPLLVTELSRELPIYQINVLAALFALAVLSAAAALRRQWGVLAGWRKEDRRRMILLGAAGIFPYTALYYLAFALAPEAAGDVNIINYLWPVWVLVFSAVLLKEPLAWTRILSLILGFLGVYLLASGGRLVLFRVEHWKAYLCAAAGAGFWGLFSVLSKRQGREPLPALFLYNLGALTCFAAVAAAASLLSALPAARIAVPAPPSLRSWLLLLALGGGANGLGYLCWIAALRAAEATRAAVLAYLTPFVALLYLAAFRGAPVRPLQLACLALILSGPVLESILRR